MATKQDLHDVVGAELRHHTTPGNKESKIFLDGIGWVVRGSVNHMLSPSTKEGKTVLGRIAQAVLSAVIPAKGVAKGNMTLGDSEGWGRNYRAVSEAQAKRIEAKLDALAVAIATESTGKHTVKGDA
ncbi:hypothetical protein [Kocuria coralli]|nr:hypothetical protein [Kocuria coralli]